jgi:tetratricopeptide (TPR) repeat protein
MKHLLFALSFVLSACILEAQNIKLYYKHINEAEKNILLQKFLIAKANYESAFSIDRTEPFAIDYYNFASLACANGDYELAAKYYRKLIALGLGVEFLKNRSRRIDSAFSKSEAGKSFFKAAPKIKLSKSIDTALRGKIFKMVALDQYFRLQPDGYTKLKDSIIAADYKNTDSMLLIIKRCGGFPAESLVGIDGNDFTFPIYYYIIFHQSDGTFGSKYEYTDIIRSSILDGRIRNTTGAELYERASMRNNYLASNAIYTLVYDSLGRYRYSFPDQIPDSLKCTGILLHKNRSIGSIDSLRDCLFLLPLSAHLQKMKLLKREDSVGLAYGGNSMIVYDMPKKEEFEHGCETLNKFQ